MQHKIEKIEGIKPDYTTKLEKLGITTIEKLLEKGSSSQGREELMQAIGVDRATMLKWLNLADLIQIKGVAQEYSKLLEAAAIDTVEKLRTSVAESLYIKLVKVNEQKQIVKTLPSLGQVENWITQAKNRPPILQEKQLTTNQNYSDWSIEWAD